MEEPDKSQEGNYVKYYAQEGGERPDGDACNGLGQSAEE